MKKTWLDELLIFLPVLFSGLLFILSVYIMFHNAMKVE